MFAALLEYGTAGAYLLGPLRAALPFRSPLIFGMKEQFWALSTA